MTVATTVCIWGSDHPRALSASGVPESAGDNPPPYDTVRNATCNFIDDGNLVASSEVPLLLSPKSDKV